MERDDLCGRTLGEFVLRERIGEGGFGAVYRCQQPLLGRQAVIKVLHRRLRENEIELQRFTREAQLASRLDHPYAAHVYAFGVEQEDGLFWIAMEMVQGTTLDRWLRDRGPLPVDQLVPFFERVAEVVETAHERGIVHRDLKPSNIMVIERAGRLLPKLLDFGIAKMQVAEHVPVAPKLPAVVGDAVTPRQLDIDTMPLGAEGVAGAIHSPLTRADAAMGSPPYMSPEQWRDALAVTPRSDLYSLGIVAYESLTGRR
ncbi:MAG TPA: serine/threonine-protein kinase, partial [Kofleriaceae bacterium]|nr:serine/threonine-protein kinase [Kofleriaceae bacterium]